MANGEKELQRKIQVLATNLEILNQKLEGGAVGSLTNEASSTAVREIAEKIDFLQSMIKTSEENRTLRAERIDLQKKIERFNALVTRFEHMDRQWIEKTMNQSEEVITQTKQLVYDMNQTKAEVFEQFQLQQKNLEKTARHLFKKLKKNNLFMLMFTAVLSTVISLCIVLFVVLNHY